MTVAKFQKRLSCAKAHAKVQAEQKHPRIGTCPLKDQFLIAKPALCVVFSNWSLSIGCDKGRKLSAEFSGFQAHQLAEKPILSLEHCPWILVSLRKVRVDRLTSAESLGESVIWGVCLEQSGNVLIPVSTSYAPVLVWQV